MLATSASREGELWGTYAEDWANRAEPQVRPLWEAMLTAAEVGQGTELLDAGCGGGGLSALAASKGEKASGLDASENLLEIARRRVPEGSFRQGDLESLPYGDAFFDVVVASNSMQFAENPQRALREASRVKKPDGAFVIGMWCEPERCEMSAVFKAVGSLLPQPPSDAPPSLANRDALLELLVSAGLRVQEEGEVECPFQFESIEDGWLGIRSAGMIVQAAKKLGEEPLHEAISIALKGFEKADGSVRMSNWFRYVRCA